MLQNIFKKREKDFPPKKVKSDLKTRINSAIVLGVVIVIYLTMSTLHTELQRGINVNPDAVLAFGWIFIILTWALLAGSLFELSRALGIKKWYHFAAIILGGLALFIWPFGQKEASLKIFLYNSFDLNIFNKMSKFWVIALIGIIYISVLMLISFMANKKDWIKKGLILVFVSLLMISALKGFETMALSFGVEPLNLSDSGNSPTYSFTSIIWVWSTIILTDSFAYLGGRKFGKNLLAPNISPKKTWEGALIGTGVATIIGFLFAFLLFFFSDTKEYSPLYGIFQNESIGLAFVVFFLMTLMISIVGQMGDLLFSAIKRYVGIKDYSKLIPGHGGILDRMDSFYLVFFIMFIMTIIWGYTI
ncbi:phosphatidate cytidylyltransferase [Mesoplasma photuris]|uniref:phosphatidate cytidylyltransferase n=1 Tax=Mesoplasma photuris TaxID=217731 RepID=UPI00068D5FB4|nr:phosphatidate cytidylyltransferase [Mesoplasma photuris]